jgi:hypothetical protein
MWTLDYTEEVKLYFLDNGNLVFNLLVKIEELKFMPEGIPAEGCTQIEEGLLWWEVLRHIVIYERIVEEKQLIITAVKPM